MSWVTVIWAMIASECLTLAGMHLLIWCRQRTAWANLLFSLAALSTAIFVGTELWVMRAETPVDFGTAVRWAHVPMWVTLVALAGFVWFYLGGGRAWLAWSFVGLRTLAAAMRPGLSLLTAGAALLSVTTSVLAADKKPNIVVIFGDDVGPWNVSAYHRGMMGGGTPNIDRLAKEGGLFTDYYSQQSCTAGRAAFILGQHPFRTGLLKVGMSGSKQGIQDRDPTIAQLLKPMGYATCQLGKNHLGDQNAHLPTVHGFDEFFGYLYHLNAMEEPEDADFPKGEQFKARFGPRNVLNVTASDKDDPTEEPRNGRVGKQVIKDAGDYPPPAKAGVAGIEQALEMIQNAANAAGK